MNDTVKSAWQALEALERPTLKALFADPARLSIFSSKLDLPGGAIRFDWSKTHLDGALLAGFEARAVVDGDLREWNYGDYEGRTKIEILAERPGWMLWDDGVPGGETLDAVAARADRFLAPLRAPRGRVLIFAHGHLLRILAARWLGLAPHAARMFVLEPAATSVVGYERDQAVIRTWNRVADPAPRPH